ncbi:helix-hairpin-helix domain-containing protein [Parafrigoribacterium soli]|uniref:helix-hairpin-helix domain-containing protein n=1 Tax=Parafrigoribacterium soli TaxID=3144663 RepID=UPI0032EFA957
MTSSGRLLAHRGSRVKLGLGAAIVLLLAGLGIAVLVSTFGSHGATQSLPAGTHPTDSATGAASRSAGDPSRTAKSGTEIFVHVVGAVARPGLFSLRDGDRVVDAIAAAGGFAESADQTQVNLARFISDGEQLIVPVVGEAPTVATKPGVAGGKVNLNTADLSTLETLPRVGPAMAQRIIDWRTSNGRFSAVEDLMSVTGVGDKTFQQLKDLVTV